MLEISDESFNPGVLGHHLGNMFAYGFDHLIDVRVTEEADSVSIY